MRKKKIFVVGYDGDHQCVYGKDKLDGYTKVADYCQPMTAFDAKRKLKDLISPEGVIYRLVPVDPKKI